MILLIPTIYQLGGRSLFHTYFSHGLYVARIGVINDKGWLLTLAKPCRQNKYQQISSLSENCVSDDSTHHDYEEIKERKKSAGHRYSYTPSKLITGSVLQTNNNNNFHHVSHEGHYPYYCYEDVPLPPALVQQSRHSSHPIHSLTGSDIEKAVGPTALDRSRIVCYCFAICLAITFLIAIVMMISNIITRMYLRF